MSSRLLTGEAAVVCEAMPWSTAGAPAPRGVAQVAQLPQQAAPPAGRRYEDLQAKIASLEQGITQARAAGRAEGEAQAKQQAQTELQPVLQKLAAAIHECGELRARLREEAESDLVRLAIAIARRVVGREITTDPEAITGVVKASLEKLRVQEVVRVRVHPSHKSQVAEYLTRFGATHVEVLGDPACAAGAVVFETSRGNLDASVETQLREIERGLTDRFKGKTS
jgi:flagellar assembly protein FliH